MRRVDQRYRLLLRLLPRAFREEHERELLRVWHDEATDAAPHRRNRLWRAALADTLRTAPGVHVAGWACDFRQAWRGLRKSPLFAATAIVTLALGTGATGGVFSLLNTVVLQPLPWRAPDRVGLVWAVPPEGNHTWLSFPEVDDLTRVRALGSVAGLSDVRFAWTTADAADEVQALAVSHTLLSTLGVAVAVGRDFRADDDREGSAPVAILGHEMWRTRFGSSPAIVGHSIVLDGSAYQVIGVLPPDFELLPASSVLPDRPDLLVALERHLASRDRSVRSLHALARLHDGATFAHANAELASLAQQSQAAFPRAYARGAWTFSITNFQQEVLASVRGPLLVTFGLVMLVLLMACANVANLLLGRGETRRTDLAVRAALGAGPGRLAGELLAESLLLAAAGCALGGALAAGLPMAIRALNPAAMPRLERLAIDWHSVGFMASLVLATAAIFTCAPMLERLRTRAALTGVATRSGGRSPRTARVSAALVTVQTMLATMVVVTTVFLVKTVAELQRVDLGFDPRGVISARLTRPPQQAGANATPGFFEQVTAAAAQDPVVSAAGAITQLPLSGALLGSTFLLRAGDPERRIDADLRGVTPGYFQAMGVRLVSGRLFDGRDSGSTEAVAIVDRTFASRVRPDGQVVGQFIRWIRQPDIDVQIVGVVDGVHHRAVSDAPRETVYRPHTQYSRASMYLVVRGSGDERALRQALGAAVASVDARQPLADVATMADRVSRGTVRQRTTLFVAAVLAALGLALAAIGLYGVLSVGVSQRLREFGVRLSLGATPLQVAAIVAWQGLGLSLVGVTLGSLAAVAVVRGASALLYGTSLADVRLYALAAAIVLASSAAAFWLPARRAAAADPLTILRSD